MSYILNLSDPGATDASRFGPKAANLAALGRAGLPIPEGICLDADAYRRQLSALDLETTSRLAFGAEDRAGSSFAGQFESYLGLESESDFLTAVRGCWAALWSTRALRYMATHGVDAADTAMAVLVQPLINARAA